MQKYIDIAFADITDYIQFGTKEVIATNSYGKVLTDENGKPLKYMEKYVILKESIENDGTIISEVSEGRDGVKIKLHDKMKALEWLSKNIVSFQGVLDTKLLEQKIEREKATISKVNAEVDKIKGISEEVEDLSEIEGEIYDEKD